MKWKKDCELQIQKAGKESQPPTQAFENKEKTCIKSEVTLPLSLIESKIDFENESTQKVGIKLMVKNSSDSAPSQCVSKDSSSLSRTESTIMDDNDDFDDESLFVLLTPTRRRVLTNHIVNEINGMCCFIYNHIISDNGFIRGPIQTKHKPPNSQNIGLLHRRIPK